MGIAGQFAAMGQFAFQGCFTSRAFLEEADRFQLDQQGDGEGIIYFRDVDIGGGDTGLAKGMSR